MSSSDKIKALKTFKKQTTNTDNTSISIDNIEKLFLSKLSEKCQLTARDLQKTFKKFDQDNSGYLDKSELTKAISLYLNGINSEIIDQLVERYDVDNDGHINISEFTTMLLSDKSTSNMNNNLATNQLKETNKTMSKTIDKPTNKPIDQSDNPITNQLKVFLQNMKQLLINISLDRLKQLPVQKRITLHRSELVESISKRMLLDEFKPFLKDNGVEYNNYKRIINKFIYPGVTLPSEDLYVHLFNCCITDSNTNNIMNPNELIHLLFDKSIETINKFGFKQNITSLTDKSMNISKGPIVITNSNNNEISSNYLTSKSHTILPTPSNFLMKSVSNSNQSPSLSYQKNHVFGLNTQLYSGSSIRVLDDKTVVYVASKLGILYDITSNTQRFYDNHKSAIVSFAISNNKSMIATGEIGANACIHIWSSTDLSTLVIIGKGFFIKGVCGITFLSGDNFICAINCDDKHTMGIWIVATGELLVSIPTCNNIAPGICMVKSYDQITNTHYISKDHNATTAITANTSTNYKRSTSNNGNHLICTVGEKHLKFFSFSEPNKFKSGTYNSNDSLIARSYQINKKKSTDTPKKFLCIEYITRQLGSLTTETPANAIVDVITGGDNGVLYMWRYGVLYSFNSICRDGSVNALGIIDNLIICGLSNGSIVLVDDDKLSTINKFSVVTTPSPTISANLSAPTSSRRYIRPKDNIKQLGEPVKKPPPTGVSTNPDVSSVSLLSYDRRLLIATTGVGKLVVLNLLDGKSNTMSYFHYGSLYALAQRTIRPFDSLVDSLIATGGDDKWLNLWHCNENYLITRCKVKQAIRCIDIEQPMISDRNVKLSNKLTNKPTNQSNRLPIGMKENPHNGCLIAIGSTNDRMESSNKRGKDLELLQLFQCQHSKRDISDVKISRDRQMLAVGSHDTYIYIYAIIFNEGNNKLPMTCELKVLQRLHGHSSYITHVDWSYDCQLLRSTCGAYEILYWDIKKGKQFLSSGDALESDTEWLTDTCTLGFQVMGIWPPNSDGTDINAIDVSKSNNLVVTGDDFDNVNLFNYPCVVKHAPSLQLCAHSSHVMNVKFYNTINGLDSWDNGIVSVGGDSNVIAWSMNS